MTAYGSTADQLFAWIDQLRQRGERLLDGERAAPWVPDEDPDARERERAALAAGVDLRLPRLRAACGLDELATSALLALAAVDLDPSTRLLVRSLQRDAGRPWMELGLLAEWLGLDARAFPRLQACFARGGALERHALFTVESGDAPRVATKVKLAARVAAFLVGDDALPEGLELCAPRATLGESLVPADVKERAVARVERARAQGGPLIVELSGPSGVGKRFLAEGLAAAVARPLLVVELAGCAPTELAARLAEARREAKLADALVCLAHWQATYLSAPTPSVHDEPGAATATPRRLPRELERWLAALDDVAFVTGDEPESLLDRLPVPTLHVAVPFPAPSQRADLLERELRERGATLADGADCYGIARRFALDPRRLLAAGQLAVESARDRDAAEVDAGDLAAACRSQLRHELTSVAERVTTSYRWEDLVIPVDVYHGLCEMIAHTRHARRVYDEWQLGARHGLSQGLSALFAGPPGTGKTMCASVMARELDMELFRIDLSRVVSKWIGETEKNLGRLFDEAQRSNAIILFDEADSLFAKRTAVKSSVDRYANLEVNYLLQRMEAFSGVTILTTNFEDTIDTAFKRRLTFRLRFERPDEVARASLWQKVFPATCALGEDFDPVALGAEFDLSGGSIRNAAVRAAFLAAEAGRPIAQEDCARAAELEAHEMGQLARGVVAPPAPRPLPSPADEPRQAVGGRAPSPVRVIPISHPRAR
jgi:AAA+ superfamily predicted ATPase